MIKMFCHRVTTRTSLCFDVDELLYEEESSAIVNEYYEKGLPDQHPEPYQSIGGGWGVLLKWMQKKAFELSGDLDICTDNCGGLLVTFNNATKAEAEAYYRKLHAAFAPVKKYIKNWEK